MTTTAHETSVRMTLVIISGGIDLAVGSVLALVAVACARWAFTGVGILPSAGSATGFRRDDNHCSSDAEPLYLTWTT